MKRILLICDYFAPQNKIASIRSTKTAKYLKRNYWYRVDVVTRALSVKSGIDHAAEKDICTLDNINRIEESRLIEALRRFFFKSERSQSSPEKDEAPKNSLKKASFKPKNNTAIKKLKSRLSNTLIGSLRILSSLAFAYAFKSKSPEYNAEYDAVFSTYGEFSGHLAAMAYKKRHPEALWIADFRDAVLYSGISGAQKCYAEYFQKKVCSAADVITGVSSGVLDSLGDIKKPAFVLPNGYDREDISNVSVPLREKLTFCYCGQLYENERDFSMLFKALSQLCNDKAIDSNMISLEYAGYDGAEFLRQASAYGMESNVHDNGFITREEALKLQAASHVLLLASWNKTGSTGIITGKFYEQLLMKKPIFCFVTGNLPGSKLKQMIEGARLGICCEYVTQEKDYPALTAYLTELYNSFIRENGVRLSPDEDLINQYDYKTIVQRLDEIISSEGQKINE